MELVNGFLENLNDHFKHLSCKNVPGDWDYEPTVFEDVLNKLK